MKNTMQFDFIVDKEKNTITVNREFAAGRQLVWDCHTKSELLDKWFAPKPFTARTKSMSFKEGGSWIYAMVDPEGQEFWARMDYTKINPIDGYSLLDGFCNKDGELNPELPRARWVATFKDLNQNTLVQTVVTYNSLADLETVINMGMKEGLTMTLENLDDLLLTLKK
ncbi:SRPBCC domain-containing protein [Fulvivirgaceae bacterium PWU4]|uniref:SRPBCC domain-containing protein n=1 Tax=Chryseosolibacter histidini TaxID=2782349 RepID=A0AAP2DJZ3_9BACT|nr:SRPBCC domain-containing protein [Chryseosolibacter histidini]MBT1696387.1 SRPBCC domain-containing protein [Chryseosolibacter histidini]